MRILVMALVLSVVAGGGWLAQVTPDSGAGGASYRGPLPVAQQDPVSLKERQAQTKGRARPTESRGLPVTKSEPATAAQLALLNKNQQQMQPAGPDVTKATGLGRTRTGVSQASYSASSAATASYDSGALWQVTADPFGNTAAQQGGWLLALGNHIGAAVPGEPLQVSGAIWQVGGADSEVHPVKVRWELVDYCTGGPRQSFDFGQTVQAPTINTNKVFPVVNAVITLPATACTSSDPSYRLDLCTTVVDDPTDVETCGSYNMFYMVPALPQGASCDAVCGDASGAPGTTVQRADPVSTATGAFSESFTDAQVAAPGVPLSVARTYSSNNASTGALGSGWQLPWETRLEIDAGGNAVLVGEGGARHTYVKSGGSFTAPGETRSVLAVDGSGYKITTADHQVYGFNAAGQLTSLKDRASRGLTMTYDGSQLSKITDAAGRAAVLHYAGARLDTVTLADGRVVDYGYSNDRLSSVKALDGAIETYGYDDAGRLSKVTDARNKTVTTNVYDAQGRVKTQTDALGQATSFAYTKNGEFDQVDTTAPDGGIWTDIYYKNVLFTQIDPFGNKSYYRYDQHFNRTSSVDAEIRETTWDYNTSGQLKRRKNAASDETWTYDSSGNVATHEGGEYDTTTFRYTNDLLTSVEDPLGKSVTYHYDLVTGLMDTETSARGKQTRYQYDAEGNLTSVTSPAGGKSTFTYDASGRMKTATDPRGNAAGADAAKYTTSYAYDAADRLTSVTDARGNPTTYDYVAGYLVKVTDAKTRVIRYDYDDAGRLTTLTDPAAKTTVTGYDLAGRVASVTDRTGAKTTYAYDKAGRQIQVITARGNAAGATKADYTWTIGYDKVGNRKTVTDPKNKTTAFTWDADNRPLATTDPLNRTRKVDYDSNGRETQTYDGLGHGSKLAYDADSRLLTSKTWAGNTTTYGYDDDGNLTSELSPEGERTTYTYDEDGRRASTTDPRGNVSGVDPAKYTWKFGYDAAGHPTSVTDPLGNAHSTDYDAVGNPITKTDGRGKQSRYEYDELNRSVKVTNPDGGVTTTGYNQAGQMETSTDANRHTTTYGYDPEGRLTSVKNPLNKTVSYGYDAEGNRTSTTNARQQTITTTLDGRGLPTKVAYSDGTPTVTYGYDDASRITGVTDATGNRTVTYNNDDRVSTITSPGAANPFQYNWNTDGTLDYRSYPDGRRTSYGYDKDGRVKSQTTDSKTTSYGYDPASNLTSVTLPTTTARAETRTYDPAGNLATLTTPASGTHTYGYDANNRLASDTPATGSATRYAYDDAGRTTRACTDAASLSCLTTSAGDTYTYDQVGNRTGSANGDTPTDWSGMAQTTSGDLNNDGITDVIAADTKGGLHTYLGKADGTYSEGSTLTGTGSGFQQILPLEYTGDGKLDVLAIDKAGHLQRYNGDGKGGFAAPYDLGQGWGPMTLSAGDFNNDGKQDFLAINSTANHLYFYPGNGAGAFNSPIDRGAGWSGYRISLLEYTGDGKLDILAVNPADGHLYLYPGKGDGTYSSRTDLGSGWAAMHLVPGDFNNDNKQDFLAVDTAQHQLRFYPSTGTGGFTPGIVEADSWTPYGDPAPVRAGAGANLGIIAPDNASQLRAWKGDGQGHLTGAAIVKGRSTAFTYDDADHLTSATNGATYSYDDDGNQTKDGAESYAYDPVGRIKSATLGSDTYGFTYDADGNRTTTTKNSALVSTSRWDINNPLPQIATDTNASGALLGDYRYDPDGTARSMDRTNGKFYFTQNQQNSVNAVYDAAGTDNYRYTYTPWGTTTGTPTITGGQTSPFGYTGQYKDQTLPDRLQLRARSYDPTQGRFTTTDPVPAAVGSPNSSAYNYANNDPLNLSDPSGACPMCIGAGIGAVLGGGIYALTHQDDFSWRGFAIATGKGAVIGAGAAFLAPAGGALASSLGLEGGLALGTTAVTDAAIGAAYTWAINTAQCQPTTPGDLLLGAVSGGTGALAKPAWNGLQGAIAARYGIASEGNLVSSLLYGGRPGQVKLPGYDGTPISGRPTFSELENLTVKYGVEFAVTYKYGPGVNGGGGQYYLHAGGQSHVRFPLEADRMLITHTHPGGAHSPSDADRAILEVLQRLGSPQRVSSITPVGGKTSLFDKETSSPWVWKSWRH
ncbi:FG-GAP-like repeat-containing protein [Streptomyces sp. NPDC055897]